MLRWRLLVGAILIAVLVGLIALDHRAPLPGLALWPFVVLLAVGATGESLALLSAVGMRPSAAIVHADNVALVAAAWAPWLLVAPGEHSDATSGGWPLAVFVAGLGALAVGEMRRYRPDGGAAANLAGGAFALGYVGVALALMVELRMAWGLGALVSFVLVVKMGDTGAYTVGRLVGRRKLVPALSPGKTVEGFVGQVAFCCAASWAAIRWLVPWLSPGVSLAGPRWNWVVLGVLLAVAGLLGDLAESLLKREAGRKDSSRWMPGLGGVLDVLDSLLLAAPAAWVFWAVLGRAAA